MIVLTTPARSLLICFALLMGCAGGTTEDGANSAKNDNGLTAAARQVSVQIAWDVMDPNANGYYVHYGPESPNTPGSCAYAERIYYSLENLDSTTSPTATITGLTSGKTYYFAVSAHHDNLESTCSNEISKPM